VRTRGRSKSITVPGVSGKYLKTKMSALNKFMPVLKKHRGSVVLDSDLESISEESPNNSRSFRRRSDPIGSLCSELLIMNSAEIPPQ
jgi:hypothetical protein